jgi:large repetitive protein
MPTRRRTRPTALRLELLEGRDTPGNLTVTYAALTHTLTVVGDDGPNFLRINSLPGDPTRFTLESFLDTINGQPGPFEIPAGVRNIAARLLAGDDYVEVGLLAPVRLLGGLTIAGGDGSNSVNGPSLAVGGALTITNGVGSDTVSLTNLSVGRSLTIRNGDGGSNVSIRRDFPGVSTVGGSVTIVNGAGRDITAVNDLNVGGGVAIRFGTADAAGNAGNLGIYNQQNIAVRSEIRGSVSVSALDGSGRVDLLDLRVGGEMTLAYGAGSFQTTVNKSFTNQPVVVRGDLTVTGAGRQVLSIGGSSPEDGVTVGGRLSVTTGAGADLLRWGEIRVAGATTLRAGEGDNDVLIVKSAFAGPLGVAAGAGADSLALFGVEARGATTLRLGDGNNEVSIDNSVFGGQFNLATGAGADTIRLDTIPATVSYEILAATTFRGPVVIREGAGVDTLTLAGTADSWQALLILSTFVVHHGAEADIFVENPTRELFPFGGSVQYLA